MGWTSGEIAYSYSLRQIIYVSRCLVVRKQYLHPALRQWPPVCRGGGGTHLGRGFAAWSTRDEQTYEKGGGEEVHGDR